MDDIAKLITDDNFIADCCRFSEGILSEAAVKHRWRKVVSETDWATMGSNDELIEAIEREKIRRMRNGQTAREKAQLHAIKAPDILDRIMTDDSISPRHKIEASREMRAIATTNFNSSPGGCTSLIVISPLISAISPLTRSPSKKFNRPRCSANERAFHYYD